MEGDRLDLHAILLELRENLRGEVETGGGRSG